MRFKLDENLPNDLAMDLRSAGHDTATCFDEGIHGTEDPNLFHHARREGRILVTFDLDFSDIRSYPPGTHAGIIALRLHRQDVESTRVAVARVLATIAESDLAGNLVIVEPTRVRIRRPEEFP
jgi:predicted nuclease of predicted toxin-antitoxin system